MKLFQALKIFGINDNEVTRKELKAIFRQLSLKHHPDHGGDGEFIKEIFEAFELLKDQYTFIIESDKEFEEDKNYWNIDNQEMEEIYKKIFHLKKLEIEICGDWLWVTGETFSFKDELKKAGLFYAKKKIAWYWRPPNGKARGGRGNISLKEIRGKYGSKKLESVDAKRIVKR
jgi:hypothetical protein